MTREEVEREIQEGIEAAREQGVICGDVIDLVVYEDVPEELV